MIKRFFLKILVSSLAALISAYILSGVHIDNFITAIMVAVVLALLNTFIKPILIFFTLPVTIVTFGLFLLIINIVIIKWTSNIVEGFEVDGWWSALLFSLLISFVTSILEGLAGTNNKK